MATKDVHFSITQPDVDTGTTGWSGSLLAVPVGTSGHAITHVAGDALVVPEESMLITISAGEGTAKMELTGTTWVWMVKSVNSTILPARYVALTSADGDPAEFTDLTQIDLSTLDPAAEPTAVWDAALAALAADVAALGPSVPDGGTTGQALVKASDTNGDVEWGDVAVAAASTTVAGVVELATSTETTTGTDTVRATTPAGVAAAIAAAIGNLIASAPSALDTLVELAAALGDDANFASTVTTALAGKVGTTGNETIAGTKTFTSAPVVPDASFTIAKTTGLQTALDARVRTDTAAQGLDSTQQANARANIDVVAIRSYTSVPDAGVLATLPVPCMVVVHS